MTDTHEYIQHRSEHEKKQNSAFQKVRQWFHSDSFKCVLMDIVAGIIILAIFFLVCVPKKYDLSVGSIAPETIKATKDVIDEVTTQERRELAASNKDLVKYNETTDELLF